MNDQHPHCTTSPEPVVTMTTGVVITASGPQPSYSATVTATDPTQGAALLKAAMTALQGVSLAAYSEALSQDNRINRNLRSMPSNPAYVTACENIDQEGRQTA